MRPLPDVPHRGASLQIQCVSIFQGWSTPDIKHRVLSREELRAFPVPLYPLVPNRRASIQVQCVSKSLGTRVHRTVLVTQSTVYKGMECSLCPLWRIVWPP